MDIKTNIRFKEYIKTLVYQCCDASATIDGVTITGAFCLSTRYLRRYAPTGNGDVANGNYGIQDNRLVPMSTADWYPEA